MNHANCGIQRHLCAHSSSFKPFPPPPRETPYLQALIPHALPPPQQPPIHLLSQWACPLPDISHTWNHSLSAPLGPGFFTFGIRVSKAHARGSGCFIPFVAESQTPLWARTPAYSPAHCWWTSGQLPPSGCSRHSEHTAILKRIDIESRFCSWTSFLN